MNRFRALKYAAQGLLARIDHGYLKNDEFGRCSICGRYSRFRYGVIVNSDSDVAVSCGWDAQFAREINITNTLKCSYCYAKFRVRCAATSMLGHLTGGSIRSIAELIDNMRYNDLGHGWHILETAACDGIFTGFDKVKNVVRSEYLDDVPRGGIKDGVRSEDLQNMTFPDNSFDVVIALDVFEHIADPFKAFSEVRRVIKPLGIGVITVPIDPRVKETKVLAKLVSGRIEYCGRKAHHGDPVRPEGSPVFTEFGEDVEDRIRSAGYNILRDIYVTKRTGVRQSVFILNKS